MNCVPGQLSLNPEEMKTLLFWWIHPSRVPLTIYIRENKVFPYELISSPWTISTNYENCLSQVFNKVVESLR